MIGHHTHFLSPAIKKKLPFLNVPALIMGEIMHNRDAQCNTGNDLHLLSSVVSCEVRRLTSVHRMTFMLMGGNKFILLCQYLA